MDRQIVYIGQIPQDTDLLQQNKNVMVGFGFALAAILGSSTQVDGLACTPNSPAALNVLVAPGSIYSLQNVDATAYGSIAADTTDQIVKQGINPSSLTLSCPAPGTSGQSVVYLIQAAYQDTDAGSTVLPYYNASNPSSAWSGPNNTGVSQNTVRKGVCTVSAKAGVAATTGTQTTPSPDAGYTGLYAVTVANGQTTITSGNIVQLTTAPFITPKLPSVLSTMQAGAANYAADTSGSANTITIAPSPIIASLTSGLILRVKVANTNTGATVMNTNGLGNVAVVTTNGSALASGALTANGIYEFVYDANGTRWQVQSTSGTGSALLAANNLSDVASASTSRTNLGLGTAATQATTTFCQTANNLSDVASASTARTNLGLGYAAKTDMQTPTSTSLIVNPRDVQDHPGVAKVTANIVGSSGSINESYNVASVVRNSTGNYTITFTTAFANTNYVVTGIGTRTGGIGGQIGVDTANKSTSSCVVQYQGTGGSTPTDPLTLEIAIFGKQ